MNHNLAYTHSTETDHVFACITCGQVIGFNKAGVGEQHAEEIDGVFVAPPFPDQWMTPCQ